ncbi:NAD(P)H-binding protein [Corynebacterium sp. CCUG 69979]|uniref:NAD(P)H-binding protein n=1 Tax=Corynebacterium sp. CCUG 69979 TaxID=2823890 RepID=UPI00210A647B|nr:NAD(P)H-binding protein [Corynebacterium sp. CCUG 69979]MCQ4625692.1 NAD(P)H-binding protein [Corynebacterium sp. CCUG 69979]
MTRTALVTGATGFIGGEVVSNLLDDGWRVRILCRSAAKARKRPWGDDVDIVEGDATNREDVSRALEGVDCAWYLLHSMDSGSGFADEEATMARQFGEEAARHKVGRIVYLGGLHPDGVTGDSDDVSEHLASRIKVGEILLDSGVPTAALQAGVVIGAESLSFKLLRHVTERVPLFIAPDWITNEITPISQRDIVHYLVAAADLPSDLNRTFDVGGPDTMPYVEMMQRYAETVQMRRRPYFTAPIMTRPMAALGLSFVTPLTYGEILPIFDSVSSDTVVKERDLEDLVGTPEGGNDSFESAVIEAALGTYPHHYRSTATMYHALAAIWSLFAPGRKWWLPLNLTQAVVMVPTLADINERDDSQTLDDASGLSPLGAPASQAALATAMNWDFNWIARRWPNKWTRGAWMVSSLDLARRAYKEKPVRALALLPYIAGQFFLVPRSRR